MRGYDLASRITLIVGCLLLCAAVVAYFLETGGSVDPLLCVTVNAAALENMQAPKALEQDVAFTLHNPTRYTARVISLVPC